MMDGLPDAPLTPWISRLMHAREGDRLSGFDIPLPSLRPGASIADVDALEARAGFAFPADYRELLLLSDGIDDFYFSLHLLSTQDWPASPRIGDALLVRDAYEQSDMLEELGIANAPGDLFPIAGGDGTDAIFLANPAGRIAPGPIIWLAHSDVSCFRSIADLFDWQADEVAYYDAGKALMFPGC